MGSSHGEITIDHALDVMNGGGVKNRADGLSNLITIFKYNHQTSGLDILKDSAYHTIFEALFKVAHEEKRLYLSAKNGTSRSKAERSLANCAEALRIATRAGAEKLKPKTVRAVLKHVTQLLPIASGEYCSAFSQSYLKVLSTLLEHQAHIEQLELDEWSTTVDFCLKGIKQYGNEGDQSSLSYASSAGQLFSTASTAHTSASRISIRSTPNRASNVSIKKKNSEELMECLCSLISASNAPVLEQTEDIFQGIVYFLNTQGSIVGHFHQVAFSALNIMISATGADETSVVKSLVAPIVPLISRLWSSKTAENDDMLNAAKDEMCTTLLLLRLHMEKIIQEDQSNDLEPLFRDMETTLRNDYARRLERSQLQLEDLDLISVDDDPRSLKVGYLRLRPHNTRAERKWAVVQVLSILDGLLHKRTEISTKDAINSDAINSEADEEDHPRKRRRVAQRLDSLIDRVTEVDAGERLLALQTLFFSISNSQLLKGEIKDLVSVLTTSMLDQSTEASIWAMLCLASCSHQITSNAIPSTTWMQHWSTAIRLATSPLHSRAACHLLHAILANGLLKYQDVAEDVKSMVTVVEISAPAVLCDASLSLMIHLLHVRNTEVPGGSLSVSQNVIRWLFGKWNPAEKPGTRYSIDIHPIDVLNIIRASLDLPSLRLSLEMTGPTGSIGQAWLRHLHNAETLRYILLLDDVPQSPFNCSVCRPAHKLYLADRLNDSSSNGTSLRRLVVELILPRFAVLLGDWQSYDLEHVAQLSSDFVRATASACITGCLISTLIQDQSLPQLAELDRMIKHLTGFLASFKHGRKNTRTLVEAILQGVQPYFPAIMSTELAHLQQFNTKLLTLFNSLAKGFGPFPGETTTSNPDDPMDLDDIFETQQSRSGIEKYGVANERRDLAMSMSPSAFYCEVSGKLVLVSGYTETPELVAEIPSTFIDHVCELSVAEALFSRDLLQEVLRGDLSFAPDDAVKLLATTETILAHQYACCEVSQGLCIDMMIGLLQNWVRDEDGDLADSAFQLYAWLINLVVPKRRPSPNVQIAIANLLFQLMRIQPAYGESQSLPSARSSLFDILSKAPIVARFRISQRVPDIFNLFVLKHHIDILNDVLETLPLDPEWAEGNAFRLYVLGKLASRWPTLLRRCVYYILEVGKLPQSIPHAARCLSGVSKALDLDDERELFKIFGSQLLFTWLESEDLDALPYAIFGYHSLEELLENSQDEISALMVMRNQDEAVTLLAAHLGMTVEQLLEKSFAKVISYSVAHDISIPPTDTSKKYVSGEARVRKILGKERWFELINLHFVDIIAMFFKLIDREQDIEKIFSKDLSLRYAASILQEIKQFSASETVLPPNHQPTFKARYLTNEIEHICKRTEFEVASLYTPTMVVFIARSLLTSIHPALGSLHTCAILRKLRVLIALAGPGALSGYPLEMLLQSIGSLVTDTECADDAIGILQYLLTAGDGYLSAVPSFVAGFAVLLLASLRIFLNSTPSSTTQASQYLATVSKAESFHSWLGARYSKYEYPRPEPNKANAFKGIVDAARGARSIGNAEIGTFESKLLLELLKDKQSNSPLLDRASRERAFSLLYSDFEVPKSYRADIFGEDILATRYSNAVLDFCKSNSSNPRFLAWGGKVLGRAFVSTGHVQPSLLQESSLRSMLQSAEGLTGVVSSKASILHLIQSMTLEDSRNTVGLAESALRLIMNEVEGHEDVDGKACSHAIPEGLRVGSNWSPYQTPPSDRSTLMLPVSNDPFSPGSIETEGWLQDLTLTLVKSVPKDATLYPLQALLTHAARFAENAFPFILHIVLSSELGGSQNVKGRLSKALRSWLPNGNVAANQWIKLLINAILYLRTQPLPNEASIADRTRWLDIDYLQAAEASIGCGMCKTALLFTEVLQNDNARSSRRSSNIKADERKELLFRIYRNVDDPDLFYGLQQTPSLSAVSGRLEFEKDGLKSLMFKGAEYDSRLRQRDGVLEPQTQSLVSALSILSLDGISHSLLQSQQGVSISAETVDSMFHTARRLEQWDLPIPQTHENDTITVYKTLQTINNITNPKLVLGAIEDGLTSAMSNILRIGAGANAIHKSLQALAILTEIDEVLNSESSEQFEEIMERFQKRSNWMKTGKYQDVRHIISSRETILSCLSRQPHLRQMMKISASDSRLVEVRTSLLSSDINRAHGALQESLTSATYLTGLIEPCRGLGLSIESAVYLETANALWDQGEMSSSIGMLSDLNGLHNSKQQSITISRSHLLAKIASQVSVARLEKPDRIMSKYLSPALKELKGKFEGTDAGQVCREFALFCDRQYQDPDSLEDLERLRKLKENKEKEVRELSQLVKASSGTERAKVTNQFSKAKIWLHLDSEEYRRLVENRDDLLQQSLENYLLSLAAWDEHDNDALRFTALWMEHSDLDLANLSVSKWLSKVPSRKFASLTNQLTSRLLDDSTEFQKLLFSLVLNVCTDHPYHGMYQIWAASKSAVGKTDGTALSRQKATQKMGRELSGVKKSSIIWQSINYVNQQYCQFAAETGDRYKAGHKIRLKDSTAGQKLNNAISKVELPPPTLQVEVAADLDYSRLPSMRNLEPQIAIASGVSAPKIITIVGSNGAKYRQLVKGGSDDLRQDAIMEQVFAQVDALLKVNTATRQRDVGIRTYKVLPLTSNAGIIEFVPNTVPLHEFLMPAHERYHPKDLRGSQCRKEISDVQSQKLDIRVKKYQAVTDRFHPVMRYFFLERFPDPDEWFARRSAYTRSTAAISMLGHVLGLGDRHGHNILLDEKTGEVVHIDLGVAFEMGRVLPVPEVVPFRLTRDIVDGMGISKTEGVFRRACEFTLDALRKQSYSIMTILDVLRYDPLYTWSISPLRLAKLQDAQSAAPVPSMAGETSAGIGKARGAVNEPSEADRALTVVSKKLSKTLSVTATVNDLINQATDEKNLAVLYAGWAAYA